MQGQKGKCKDKKENARTTKKPIPWIASSKSSDQKVAFVYQAQVLHCDKFFMNVII